LRGQGAGQGGEVSREVLLGWGDVEEG
jgi:hypothetical protein